MGQYSFSVNLRKYRKGKKLSQAKLAECVGVSQKTVSAWELNERYPTVDKLYDIARVLKIDVETLVSIQK